MRELLISDIYAASTAAVAGKTKARFNFEALSEETTVKTDVPTLSTMQITPAEILREDYTAAGADMQQEYPYTVKVDLNSTGWTFGIQSRRSGTNIIVTISKRNAYSIYKDSTNLNAVDAENADFDIIFDRYQRNRSISAIMLDGVRYDVSSNAARLSSAASLTTKYASTKLTDLLRNYRMWFTIVNQSAGVSLRRRFRLHLAIKPEILGYTNTLPSTLKYNARYPYGFDTSRRTTLFREVDNIDFGFTSLYSINTLGSGYTAGNAIHYILSNISITRIFDW